MPNHVQLILAPRSSEGLARAIGKTHRQVTALVNARARWTGHLIQRRFSSVALDQEHPEEASRDVALKAVRARMAAQAQDRPWSSVRAHLAARADDWGVAPPF